MRCDLRSLVRAVCLNSLANTGAALLAEAGGGIARSAAAGSPDGRTPRLNRSASIHKLPLLLTLLAGCGAAGGLTDGGFLRLLGVEPLPRSADGGTPDGGNAAGLFMVAASVAAADALDVHCEGTPCPVVRREQRPGANKGVLAVIVDGSGSNNAAPSLCTGCPTDPDNRRRAAVAALFRRLLRRAPAWRGALFDFGDYPNGGFVRTRLLAGYSSSEGEFLKAAEKLSAGGWTYVYDSLLDVLPTVAGEARARFPDGGVPLHVLLVSDGEDTSSWQTLGSALERAREFGVRVSCVGYGQRGDGGQVVLAPKAWQDLRQISAETGGFTTVVSADELPELFERIADAYVDGYAHLLVSMPDRNTRVSGTVSSGAAVAPFTFEEAP